MALLIFKMPYGFRVNVKVTSFTPTSMTFPALVITRLINAEQKSVPIHYSEFHHNATTDVGSTYWNSFDGPKKTKALNPHTFFARALKPP
jgi:hypothetical protein